MAEEPNQDNERDGHAQEQQQYGPHLLSLLNVHSSNNHHTVALLTADRCSKARAKSTDQEREECPVHGVRDRSATVVRSLLRFREGVIHSLLGIGFARARVCRYDLGQIRPVSRRQISFSQAVRENESNLAAHQRMAFVGSRHSPSQQPLDQVFIRSEAVPRLSRLGPVHRSRARPCNSTNHRARS